MKLAIIMPAYNEGDTIEATIEEIGEKIIKRMPDAKVMVFEDGSKDNTREVLKMLVNKFSWLEAHVGRERLGYPKAVKNAFASVDETKYDYILFTDSDGQYDPEDFFKLLSIMQVGICDMVVAERVNRAEPFYRVILSKGLHLIERSIFDISYSDVTSAFRLMKTPMAKQIASEVKYSDNNFWLEFSARASKKPIGIVAVDVGYRQRSSGGSKVYKISKIPKIVLNELNALIKTRMEIG